ncbi:Mediator complex, subunit Med7 [Prunus dulcis]|uniref:Mediator of RNA polymerase II transcription subunit 7 n=1 Tax=Prunus dulcis TaxID=3755 RepID=A0A4Y1REY4_PRUDU|nr:Mediator complex, subunit Med7 [Prunus dulcis]
MKSSKLMQDKHREIQSYSRCQCRDAKETVFLGLARRCWQWLQRHIHHHHRIISSTKITCKIPNQLRSRPLRFKGHAFVMTDDILPSLEDQGVHQLYPKGPNIDFKKELRSLNRELQLHILELADILVERPSQYARRVEDISLIFKNLHHLLNSLRPIKLGNIQRRKQAVEDIKRRREEARDFSRSLLERWRTPTHLLC